MIWIGVLKERAPEKGAGQTVNTALVGITRDLKYARGALDAFRSPIQDPFKTKSALWNIVMDQLNSAVPKLKAVNAQLSGATTPIPIDAKTLQDLNACYDKLKSQTPKKNNTNTFDMKLKDLDTAMAKVRGYAAKSQPVATQAGNGTDFFTNRPKRAELPGVQKTVSGGTLQQPPETRTFTLTDKDVRFLDREITRIWKLLRIKSHGGDPENLKPVNVELDMLIARVTEQTNSLNNASTKGVGGFAWRDVLWLSGRIKEYRENGGYERDKLDKPTRDKIETLDNALDGLVTATRGGTLVSPKPG